MRSVAIGADDGLGGGLVRPVFPHSFFCLGGDALVSVAARAELDYGGDWKHSVRRGGVVLIVSMGI